MSAPELPPLAHFAKTDDGPAFAAPWQAQAFALVVALHQGGAFSWGQWTEVFAQELEAAEGRGYYECWVAALERLARERRLADAEALVERVAAWADAYRRTPHGSPVTL